MNPPYRYLRGYALDPGFSTRLETAGINEVVYRVPFEAVQPGPRGDYVEVVDYDPASGCWYDPVDLSKEAIASQQGVAPSEGTPQFHQQFVYAVVMKTIKHFEHALGRKIIWHPSWHRATGTGSDRRRGKFTFVRRLRIYPHALRAANAYYDPQKKALLFGYFEAAHQSVGANFPGGLVFTCLSPDIVAHETTHAILDSIHHRYIEDTNPDVAAFHEGFADIVALLQRFTMRSLVEDQLRRTRGKLSDYTVLGELATQFGEALEGHRGALRSMIGRWAEDGKWEPLKPSPADYAENSEAHDRGAVLVATIFDAFQRIYAFRTADLFRIASNGTGELPAGSIGVDLAGRLAREAQLIAEHLLHICIRALDYCPPVDISFGDYLRALITADLDIAPEDENGYRIALIEAFRARGIFPPRVTTLSAASLCWNEPDFTDAQRRVLGRLCDLIKDDVRGLMETRDRKEIFERSDKAQGKLHALFVGKQAHFGPKEWEPFLNKLGLTSRPVSELFGADGKGLKFVAPEGKAGDYVPPIEVHTVRPAFRTGREGRQIEQVLITLAQSVVVEVGTDEPCQVRFRGGCTLILNLCSLSLTETKSDDPDATPAAAPPEYVVVKNLKSYGRFKAQLDYMSGESNPPRSVSLYAEGRERQLNFMLLHR